MLDNNKLYASTLDERGTTKVNHNPFLYLNSWDFAIMFIAIIVRMLVVMNAKSESLKIEGKNFNFKAYFDSKHILRWSLHSVSSVVVILILPKFFVEVVQRRYFSELDEWTLLSSAIVGFLGYDIVKIFESVGKSMFKKIGVSFDN